MSFEESLNQARRLEKKGDNVGARQIYQEVLRRDPSNRKARKSLKALEAAMARPDPAQLQRDFQTLVGKYSSGDLDGALGLARQLGQTYPGQPLPFNITGAILSARGDHAAAIPNFAQALRLEPRYPDALANLAAALDALGRFDEAAHIYRQHLAVAGESAEGMLRLGACLGRIHQRAASIECFQRALALEPASVAARVQIGDALSAGQRYREALNWYREAVQHAAQDKPSPPALLGLGRCLLHLGEPEEAAEVLQACLALAADNSEAQHLLNAARSIDSDSAPPAYVRKLFDSYAPTFEQHLVEELGYRAPAELLALLQETLPFAEHFPRMADLGCGTGVGGRVFKPHCESISGIDLSPRMLEQAAAKGCYDQLLNGEISAVLAGAEEKFDLFLCADTAIYIGKLDALAASVADAAAPGALLCLSTEDFAGPGFKLLPTGRYSHSEDYVQATFAACGFALAGFKRANLRREQSDWLQGGFYLFRYRT